MSDWAGAVNTHTLLDEHGDGAVPVSEARFLWGHHQLYVAFYAGDLDLQVHNQRRDGPVWNDDSFTLFVYPESRNARLVTVSATGIIADGTCPAAATSLSDARCDLNWQSRARVAVDYDGTINHLGDHDEEWNVQLAIPLSSLGITDQPGTQVHFAISRCEIAYNGQRSCGAWGSPTTPALLILD